MAIKAASGNCSKEAADEEKLFYRLKDLLNNYARFVNCEGYHNKICQIFSANTNVYKTNNSLKVTLQELKYSYFTDYNNYIGVHVIDQIAPIIIKQPFTVSINNKKAKTMSQPNQQ